MNREHSNHGSGPRSRDGRRIVGLRSACKELELPFLAHVDRVRQSPNVARQQLLARCCYWRYWQLLSEGTTKLLIILSTYSCVCAQGPQWFCEFHFICPKKIIHPIFVIFEKQEKRGEENDFDSKGERKKTKSIYFVSSVTGVAAAGG